MINPKELRQGNNVWVTFTEDQTGYGKDYIGEIVGIIENKVRVKGDWHWIELYGISPIPLSPEILEKAEFSKPSHSYICERFHITKQDNSDYWWTAFNKNNACINKIRYVHELQNLHWILTGQELTINLK